MHDEQGCRVQEVCLFVQHPGPPCRSIPAICTSCAPLPCRLDNNQLSRPSSISQITLRLVRLPGTLVPWKNLEGGGAARDRGVGGVSRRREETTGRISFPLQRPAGTSSQSRHPLSLYISFCRASLQIERAGVMLRFRVHFE